MIHVGQKRVTKGYINFIEEAVATQVPFMFNPQEVRIEHGWQWGEQPIPGRSHPHYSGGAGKGQTFSFTLVLDADRGNVERRRRNNPNANSVEDFLSRVNSEVQTSSAVLENLRPLMDKFHQFVLPGEKRGIVAGSYGVPRRIIINLGSVLHAEVGIDDVSETITKYGPTHNILKATVEISGHVREKVNVTNRTLVRRSQRYDVDLPDLDKDERFASLPNLEP